MWGTDRKICLRVTNSDPEGRIFLSAPNNHDRFFFLHTFWSPAFGFNIEVAIKETCFHMLKSAILNVDAVWRRNDVNYQHLKDRVMWHPIQRCIDNMCCYSFFICPTCRIRVCKIRFVSTGENRGKSCLVCKKMKSLLSKQCRPRSVYKEITLFKLKNNYSNVFMC